MTSNDCIKLLVGATLFGTLVALTVFNVPHAERLTDLIYAALMSLGITHLNTPPGPPSGAAPANPFRAVPTQPQGECHDPQFR